MPVWRTLRRGGWTAVRGGRRLHEAAERADGAGDAPEVAPVETQVSVPEAILLARYLAAKTVVGWLELVFLLKYVALVLGILVWWLADQPVLGALLIGVFLVAATVQWVVTRMIGRFGAFDDLQALDVFTEDAPVVWWPNLRRELERVGLQSSPWALTKLGAGAATRRMSDEQRGRFEEIDWLAVAPRDQWRQARQALADAAAVRR